MISAGLTGTFPTFQILIFFYHMLPEIILPQRLFSPRGTKTVITIMVIEQIPDQQFKTPEQICIEVETPEKIYHALAVIAPRERTYLYYRYGLGCYDEHDRSKAAKHFHLSISRAKKLECLALDNFRL